MARTSTDPTRTLTLRNRFAGETYRRFRHVKGLVRETLVEHDALRTQQGIDAGQPASDLSAPTRAGSVDRFMDWLRRQENQAVLGTPDRPREPARRSTWVREHLRSGYAQGVQRARHQAEQAGVSLGEVGGAAVVAGGIAALLALPTHEDSLDLLHDRVFRDLVAILEAQDAEASRVLVDALTRGQSNRELARRLGERVDAVGIHRGRLLARTAIVRAHAEAQLNELERLGFDEVVGEVELATANDSRVCPLCRALEGTRRRIAEARGVIPVHPSCRCAWVPVLA